MPGFLVLALMLLSLFGYCLYFNARFSVRLELAPALTASLVIFTVFWGGILNVLRPAALLILLLGCAAWIAAARRMKRADWKAVLTNPALLFLALCCCLLFFCFRGRILYAYDDFSHWGTIVRCMLQNNRFPTSGDTYIMFQSYPPGSACWMYYLCLFQGQNEGMYLAAQGILIVSLLLPVFSFARRPEHVALCCVAVVLAYTNALSPFSLAVDALLAASGVSAILAILLFERDGVAKKLLLIPLITCPILVKNSGIFFYIIALALLLYLARRKQKAVPGRAKRAALICLTSCAALGAAAGLLLWISPAAVKGALYAAYSHRGALMDALVAAIALAAAIWAYRKRGSAVFSECLRTVALVAVPVLCLYFWQRHVTLVFPKGLYAKHSLSLSYFANVLRDANVARIGEVVRRALSWAFSFEKNGALWVIAGCLLMSAGRVFARARHKYIYIYIYIYCGRGAAAAPLYPVPDRLSVALRNRHGRHVRVQHAVCGVSG